MNYLNNQPDLAQDIEKACKKGRSLDENQFYEDGKTFMEAAVNRGDTESVYLLLERGAKINPTTLIHRALELGHLEIVKAFLAEKPDLLNLKDQEGFTPAHRAVFYDNQEAIDFFKKQSKVNWNNVNHSGESPIFDAIGNQDEKTMNFLLHEKGVDLKQTNKMGQTPLDVAEQLKYSKGIEAIKSREEAKPKKDHTVGKKPDKRKRKFGFWK